VHRLLVLILSYIHHLHPIIPVEFRLAVGLVALLKPQKLIDYTYFEETGNLVSSQNNVYRKAKTGSIVSEYEHAVESDDDEDSASSDEDDEDDSDEERR
jgi:hypothetical protein